MVEDTEPYPNSFSKPKYIHKPSLFNTLPHIKTLQTAGCRDKFNSLHFSKTENGRGFYRYPSGVLQDFPISSFDEFIQACFPIQHGHRDLAQGHILGHIQVCIHQPSQLRHFIFGQVSYPRLKPLGFPGHRLQLLMDALPGFCLESDSAPELDSIFKPCLRMF